jgi:hypothetical protein
MLLPRRLTNFNPNPTTYDDPANDPATHDASLRPASDGWREASSRDDLYPGSFDAAAFLSFDFYVSLTVS